MRLGDRESSNVEDRRGMGPMVAGGGLGTVVLALIVYLLGGDPGAVIQQPSSRSAARQAPSAQDDAGRQFVSRVLADTEDTWHTQFRAQLNREYVEPKLVLFTDAVDSACGMAESAMGPFYCPGDQKVYIDLGFYRDLKERFGAPGDFAQAYVIAHEIGHHVQNQLGIDEKVARARQQRPSQANALSVRLELQADCLAGTWAHHAQKSKQILEQGDLEEALNAAAAIGDDRLQKQSRGRVSPESFTHGSSAQRVRWFRTGFDTGRVQSCDTFNASQL